MIRTSEKSLEVQAAYRAGRRAPQTTAMSRQLSHSPAVSRSETWGNALIFPRPPAPAGGLSGCPIPIIGARLAWWRRAWRAGTDRW